MRLTILVFVSKNSNKIGLIQKIQNGIFQQYYFRKGWKLNLKNITDSKFHLYKLFH